MPPNNPRAFELRDYSPPPPSPWKLFIPLLGLLLLVIGGSYWFYHRSITPKEEPLREDFAPVKTPYSGRKVAAVQPPKVYWRKFVYPTARTNLLDAPVAESFQDTGAGVAESGMFGTVRTSSSGLGQFHEGLDIKCIARDRRGEPLDQVFAAADGRVAYVNRVAGNSNYGKYIVLLHEDPAGEMFTLYAHLQDIDNRVRDNATISAGETIGLMGHTSSAAIPASRAHLHFEIGFVINANFAGWYRARHEKPDHGPWHGWNLLGLNPLDAFREARENGRMDGARLLRATPVAFTAEIRAKQLPDYFRRYSALWQGAPFDGTAFVITASENGTPLSGRNATTVERAKLGNAPAVILSGDAAVIGRNGRRLAQSASGGTWRLGSSADDWLEILLYPQRVR